MTLAVSGAPAAPDIGALSAELARVRELPFLRAVPTATRSADEARAEMRALVDEMLPDAEAPARSAMLAELELLPRDYPLKESLLELLSEQVAGYYNTRTRQLTVVDLPAEATKGLPEWADEAVLAHELDHALTDQHFDLARLIDDPALRPRDDLLTARHALAEGDALLAMMLLAARRQGLTIDAKTLPPSGALRLAIEADTLSSYPRLAGAPAWVRASLVEPYVLGLDHVSAAWRRGGWKAVDLLWRRPPNSTEQLLHPERAGDEPVLVAPPALAPGWRVESAMELGEAGLRLWLAPRLGAEGAASAAAGWDGDRLALLSEPGGAQRVVLRTAWDSPAEADEFAATAEAWLRAAKLDALDGRAAWQVARSGATVDVEMLAGAGIPPEPEIPVEQLEPEPEFPELR